MDGKSSQLGSLQLGAATLGSVPSGGSDSHVISVSATTGINLAILAGAGGSGTVVNASASTTVALAGVGVGTRPPRNVAASATSRFIVAGSAAGSAIGGGPKTLAVSASNQMTFRDGAGSGAGRIVIATATGGIGLGSTSFGGRNGTFTASATTGLALSLSASEYVSPVHVSASTGMSFASKSANSATKTHSASAGSALALLPQADFDGQIRTVAVSAVDAIELDLAARANPIRILAASATSGINLYGNIGVSGSRLVSATTRMVISSVASKQSTLIASAASALLLAPSAHSGGRVVSASATTALGMASLESTNRFIDPDGYATVILSTAAHASVGYNNVVSGIGFRDLATASVELPSGVVIPGGDSNSGLRSVVYPGISGTFPMSFAETPTGVVLLANGVDPMLRWDGLSGTSDTVGVSPPTTPIALAGTNFGTLTGLRYAYCRFIDKQGNPSALSPLSNAVNLGRSGFVENIAFDPKTGIVVIQSTAHGFDATDTIVLGGIGGIPLSGLYAVSTIDPDHFALTSARLVSGTWLGGGWWTWGCGTVVYGGVPIPLESKVARRQILRNLQGVADVFYVDVDTTDLLTPTLTSTLTDDQLSANEAVPITTTDELPYASRYALPPSHKSILASHSGRIFACGEVAITAGNVVPRFGSFQVAGFGTAWTATMAGRFLYVAGASQAYEIAAVNPATQVITLVSPYADPTQPYAAYSIRPAPAERRLVYFTEPGMPESWPPWNAFAIPEENDEIVGMMSRTGFLYFIEQRHIHRFTMQDDPATGQDFAAINRGAINNRCVVQVENTTYMLDEAGIHAFDGGQATEAISTPIQTLFQSDGLLGGLQVDWAADPTLWHATHDAVRNTIRWFVQMGGFDGIFHAICYDHRQLRWWVEQYPTAITASTTGIVGYRRSLVGTDARRVIALGEGSLDLVGPSGSGFGGNVSNADSTSLTDIYATFPANLAGSPVSIPFGTGRGQQRMICDNTANVLTVVQPWDVIPDATSTYQVGGVNWSWRSGWFEYVVEEENENARDINITYQPTTSPASLDMQLFYDHSAGPQIWNYPVNQDGVEILQGDPNITINLQSRSCRSGWSLQRFGGHSEVYAYGEQYLQILLAGVQASESVRIFQVTLNGVRTDGDD